MQYFKPKNTPISSRVINNSRISLYLYYYPAIYNPDRIKMNLREYLGIDSIPVPKMKLNVISTMGI